MYTTYLLINESRTKTYVGFTSNLDQRVSFHRNRKVKSTKNFDSFTVAVLEIKDSLQDARKSEKYWKSASGRIKLKSFFKRS